MDPINADRESFRAQVAKRLNLTSDDQRKYFAFLNEFQLLFSSSMR